MSTSSKANGKAKAGPSDKYLFPTSSPYGFGLPTAKSCQESLPVSAREWSEWSHLENVTGARTRLIADEWEGASSKWTVRTSCE
ncbi:hypothetical protein D9756_005474 [Leucocoprinus leucothites]|uniref:Uncharacterized protein n=1 Tax=Leucocoprinus leucothites TaxID=201217 RepID=A0A8H5D800_9AGAR|nr:hypothetical protein D9756_005474 [Leucoagaricus leucothites]